MTPQFLSKGEENSYSHPATLDPGFFSVNTKRFHTWRATGTYAKVLRLRLRLQLTLLIPGGISGNYLGSGA